jgi:predicted phosphodiesterase
MQTLVISDIHLGRKFDQQKLDFLYSLFSLYDQIILNGDFWCYYSFDFKDFLESKWNALFPVLKEKETIYVYGNHDRQNWCNEGVKLFSGKQVSNYLLKSGNKKFFIEHGDSHLNKLCFGNDLLIKTFRKINPIIYELMDKFGLNTYPLVDNTVAFLGNKFLKKYVVKDFCQNPNTYYVSGHTHYAEFDKDVRYINTGYIGNRLAQYLEIGENHSELFSVDYK